MTAGLDKTITNINSMTTGLDPFGSPNGPDL